MLYNITVCIGIMSVALRFIVAIQLFHTVLGDSQNYQPFGAVDHLMNFHNLIYYPTNILKELFSFDRYDQ